MLTGLEFDDPKDSVKNGAERFPTELFCWKSNSINLTLANHDKPVYHNAVNNSARLGNYVEQVIQQEGKWIES